MHLFLSVQPFSFSSSFSSSSSSSSSMY
jgi:hypothetical protein